MTSSSSSIWRFWRSESDDDYECTEDDDFLANTIRGKKPQETTKSFLDNADNVTPRDNGWEVAFRNSCLRQNSLILTPEAVWEENEKAKNVHKSNEEAHKESWVLPDASKSIIWTLSNREGIISAIVDSYMSQEYQQEQKETEARLDLDSNTWLNKLTSKFIQSISLNADVDDLDYNEEEDDFVSKSETSVRWNDMIVHTDLAIQGCKDILQSAGDKIMFRQGDSKYTFLGWIRSLNSFVAQLPEDQIVILLDVMIKMKKVTIQEDILVFGHPEDVQIALFRLQVTLDTMETRLQNWADQRDSLVRQAQKFKQQNRLTSAKSALQRKRQYDHFIDQTHQIVLNLELTQQALTMAQSQAEVLPLLKESSSMYKSLRKDGITLDQVDNLIFEWTEEVENMERTHMTFESNNRDYEEDILCGELESLMLEDHPKDASSEMLDDAKNTEPPLDDASPQTKSEEEVHLSNVDQGNCVMCIPSDLLTEDTRDIKGENVPLKRHTDEDRKVENILA
jgi:Snf7